MKLHKSNDPFHFMSFPIYGQVTTVHETRLAQLARNVGAGASKPPEIIKRVYSVGLR